MPNSRSITRKNSLKLGCAVVSGAALTRSRLDTLATREPEIAMTQNTFGGNPTQE